MDVWASLPPIENVGTAIHRAGETAIDRLSDCVTGSLPINANWLCEQMRLMMGGWLDPFYNQFEILSIDMNDLGDFINFGIVGWDPFGLDAKINAITSFGDSIDSGISGNIDDVSALLSCLGGSVIDLFAFDLTKLAQIPTLDFSKFPQVAGSLLWDYASNVFECIFDPFEFGLWSLMFGIGLKLDLGSLDLLLNLSTCYSQHCLGYSNKPAVLQIESFMNDKGFNIGGDINLDHFPALQGEKRNHIEKIISATDSIGTKIEAQLKLTCR